MLSCLPTKIKCEWANLKCFVTHFNNRFHAQYTLTKCLDLEGSTGPQPEILLDSPGRKSLVIERKSIVYPKDFVKYHQTDHEFGDTFFEKLRDTFDDDVYQLELNPKNLRGDKKKIHDMACQIADTILKQKFEIIKTGYIASSTPIRWSFRRLDESEKDIDTPPTGVGISFGDSSEFIENFFKEFYRNPAEYLTKLGVEQEERYSKAQKEVTSIIRDLLDNASAKFKNYSMCLKILVLEVYGDDIEFSVGELIKTIDIPDNIDHVWLLDRHADDFEQIYQKNEL